MVFVFAFDHKHDTNPMNLKDLLGGKGANLAEMTSVLGLPVPPGFTITTDACRAWLRSGWPAGLDDEIEEHVAGLERRMAAQLGDPRDPLLVSVRSGAKFSMPGMMDTVLDLGLNDESVEGLASRTDRRFAYDSYRRFLSLFGSVVLGVSRDRFEEALAHAKATSGASSDADLAAEVLEKLAVRFREVIEKETGSPFPADPRAQLRLAVEAVFRSWSGARAVAYRNREHIPHDLGTAVNVQVMVYGNRDERSGTGVGFTRDPTTGAPGAYGDFLVNAQGEDVVSGTRTTLPISALGERFPEIHVELLDIFRRLELHYRDMLDTEFTIESGHLWMLQTRSGKRTGVAALRIAVDMAHEPEIALTPAEAVSLVRPEHLEQLLHPQLDAKGREPLTRGLSASPGAAVGRVYFTADDVVRMHRDGQAVILVRSETSPEDVHGMQVAAGILTARGGLVSHAAVVARGWGIPAVVGAEEVNISTDDTFTVGDTVVREGDTITVDGTTGAVFVGEIALVEASTPPELEQVLAWADEVRRDRGGMQVWANADTGADAARARSFGAVGIGLCRTEHMFLGDRLPVVRRMIIASTPDEEKAALQELLEVQRDDFEGIFAAMDGLPVVVRLLDPPLHEFLPRLDEILAREADGGLDEATRALFAAARGWHEENPMLGTRGVRLAIVKTGLYAMQTRAVMQAAAKRQHAGGHPVIKIMVPLVVTKAEFSLVRGWIDDEVDAIQSTLDSRLDVAVGTMIETPRAALRGAEIAEVADFFSFGTNDLTQMTFGFSRDDVEGRLMSRYLAQGLLPRNPFESIDRIGVGELVRVCVERGRGVRADMSIGVCGEHGGDPDSISFFHDVGLDYVSCSPFRVPVARLAAAHAAIATG
ncbi:MAG: pyruvate, phosphate dikinase [Actinobacteria bacterium]|nr:MAG: pyruvate, phosphate dikinase [Actinomycetota bacterium]